MAAIYYTYVYIDPRYPSCRYGDFDFSGQPFYVGKGKNRRAWTHLSESKNRTHNTLKYDKIHRIIDAGHQPVVTIVQDGMVESDALALEQQLISMIGTKWTISGIPRGPLCNMTSGGEGTTPSEELRDRYKNVGERNGMFGKTHTTEARQKISEFRKQFKHTVETKQRMAELRQSASNPHNERWVIHCPDGDICTSFLKGLCEDMQLTYHSLYTSYKTGKPITRGKCKGYRLSKITEA